MSRNLALLALSICFFLIPGASLLDAASPLTGAQRQGTAQQPGTEQRPNIVVFLSDDHTYRDSSVYGSPDIDTPNMDRLAAAGMTCDAAYVNSPSCAPSRAALLTGLYPSNNGAEPNHSRPQRDLKKLPAYLQTLGYEVAAFGKVGHYAQTPEYGFDVARHFNYHEDVAVGKAMEWLRARDDARPLCLFVGTNWPHVPWPRQTDHIDRDAMVVPPNHVDNKTTREWRARYVAAVETMDRELGTVYDTAREILGEDTFFLHTSDHGAQWPFAKWTLYEDGTRTPMIACWPGKIPAGTRTDAMISWIDILPTLVAVAGGDAPQAIDGRSFLPVLTSQTDSHRESIFTTHSGDGKFNVYPARAVRSIDGWKYIRNLHPEFRFTSHSTWFREDGGYWDSWVDDALSSQLARDTIRKYQQRPAEELYRLADDPYEQQNLAGDPAHAEQLQALRQQLDQWLATTNDSQQTFGPPKRIAAATAPNIITVFIDDMGFKDLSCFGGQHVQTEHIDRLANEGIRFTQFYVNSPICSPSRTALTTGQYPQRWRISSYLNNRKSNRERGVAQWLDPQAPVLARELRHHGYFTGHFGKWHMGGQRDVGNAPLISAYGFDRSLTNFEGLGPRVLGYKDFYDGKKPKLHDLGSNTLGNGPIEYADRSVITARFVERALQHIDQAEAKGQPFFINVWPDDVHSPFFPPEVLRDATDESKRQLYYAVLDAMDQQLAPLFDRVRNDPKLKQNTLIVVCSDNGPEPGAGQSDPFRGMKTWLYEGGVRSPLIVWGPGLIASDAAGTLNDTSYFSAIDLNRSLYSLTQTPLPKDVELDGDDVLDTLLGKSKQSRQRPLFFRRPPDRPGFSWGLDEDNPDLAVREGQWKYMVNYDGSNPQLFNLDSDPMESKNLAEQFPEVTAKLHGALMDWNSTLPLDAGDPDFGKTSPDQTNAFRNPIGRGADPWVIRIPPAARAVPSLAAAQYLWCSAENDLGIAIRTSESLIDFGTKHVVWRAPEDGPLSRQVWAPELHFLDGHWHIYFAASDGDNATHLTYVLRSEGLDPLGPYEVHGPLATGDGSDGRSPNIWAIDMTVLELESRRYAIWSGWDAPGTDRQFLYIAPMKSPTELAGPRVRLCPNDQFPWEFTEGSSEGGALTTKGQGRGLNEAPQVLQRDGRTFVTFSCAASWLPTYKLGMLELTGSNPLDPAAWIKKRQPVFQSTPETFGVGHSCFVKSPDDSQWWHVFHAKRTRDPGWDRHILAQPMEWNANGRPNFGRPVDTEQWLPRPSDRPQSEQTQR